MPKKLYQGKFNFNREVHEEFVRAHNEQEAWRLFTVRLAAKLKRTTYSMRVYFDGKRNNYSINEVIDKLK